MITKYEDFIKEGKHDQKHEYGCVMLDLDVPNWKEVTSVIHPDDIYSSTEDSSYGIQNDPHVTVLYGIHSDVDDSKVVQIINKWKHQDLSVETTGLENFQNQNFDVVKYGVNTSQNLQDFNKELSELPNSNEFPEYKPHVTVGYLQPGSSTKYLNPQSKLDFKVKSIRYSKPDGQNLIYNLY